MGALPNPNDQSFLVWIVNQYLKNQFKSSETASIKELLTNFVRVKPKLEKKDIGQYKTVSDLSAAVDALKDADLRSNKEKERDFRDMLFKTGEAELIHRDSEVIVIGPKTERASCYFGTNTKWCTAAKEKNKFNDWFMHGPLYIFMYQKKKYQLYINRTDGDIQFLDELDKKFPVELQLYLISRVPSILETIKKTNKTYYKKLQPFLVNQEGSDVSEKEKEIATNPTHSLHYASSIIKGPWPPGEKSIASNPKISLAYAEKVIKGPWPPGENKIATDPSVSLAYAKKVIKGRWKKGEPAILRDPDVILRYVKTVLKKRWPEAEPYILENRYIMTQYANTIIKGRWPEAEQFILNKEEPAYPIVYYAIDVIKGRWPEAEKYVLESPNASVKYATDVIKGRWPEAEKYVLKSPNASIKYATEVIGGRWPEAEPYILKKGDGFQIFEYASNLIKGRWPEAEPVIVSKPEASVKYAINMLKGRWPEAEPYILEKGDGFQITNYAANVIKGRWPEAEEILKKNPAALYHYKEKLKI